MRTQYEDFYTIRDEKYHELYRESIMKFVAAVLLPCLFLYGAYVLLNGQISPGGGFSGGAVLGSGLIICAAAFGFRSTDRVITKKDRESDRLLFARILQFREGICILYRSKRAGEPHS